MGYIQHRSEESVQDYLETILILNERLTNVRSIDIANEMGFSKPSVSVAMKNLRNSECIVVTEEGYIRLTEKGQQIASEVYEKHTILADCLIQLGVDPEVARNDACKIEHDISRESFDKIKEHLTKVMK